MAWCGHVWYQLSLEKTMHVLPISLSTIPATYAALPGFDCCFLSSGITLISTMLLPSWCHSLMAMKGCVCVPIHDFALAWWMLLPYGGMGPLASSSCPACSICL